MIKAAGVLPISINPKGEIVLLLGKERPTDHKSKDSGTWCGFGGKLESKETPEEGAAREFEEESMSLWMKKEKMLKILTINFNRRLIARYTDGRYQEFAVYFKYDAEIPDQFSRVLDYFQRCNQIAKICPPFFFEKSEVKWFPLQTVVKNQIKGELRPVFYQMLLQSYPHLVSGISRRIKMHHT